MSKSVQKYTKRGLSSVTDLLSENFGFSWGISLAVVCFITIILCAAIFWFIHAAPPRSITITGGPEGSSFERNAEKYKTILARNGVTLTILTSQGSQENIQRLQDRKADIGFIQGGSEKSTNDLMSLGNIAYQPLMIFYRSSEPISLLSAFEGKQLAIGAEGSGTRSLAVMLLKTNGVTDKAKFLDLDAANAAKALSAGTIDAVFLMGDSASSQIMRSLLHSPEIKLYDFKQAEAYTRRFVYLNKLRLPEGSIDLGKNLPSADSWLIGPTVELIAQPTLNPAISDLLLEAAREVHGGAGLLQNQDEFPNVTAHDYPISQDASRYYVSGKKFLYRQFPFWIASILNRVMVAFVPMMLILIPGLKLIPTVYKWKTRLKLYKFYRLLLVLEIELAKAITPAKREDVHQRLNEIEKAVKIMRVPASFADQFYGLRGHIEFVRSKLTDLKTQV